MPGFGNHTYWMEQQEEWSSKNATPDEKAFDKLPAHAVLDLVKRAAATDAERAAADQFHQDEKLFRTMYPAYRDTASNVKAMKLYWKTAFDVDIPSFEQIEESFFATREAELLQLDAKEVAKEDHEKMIRRAAEIREQRAENEFSEEKANSLSLEEVRRRANLGLGWL